MVSLAPSAIESRVERMWYVSTTSAILRILFGLSVGQEVITEMELDSSSPGYSLDFVRSRRVRSVYHSIATQHSVRTSPSLHAGESDESLSRLAFFTFFTIFTALSLRGSGKDSVVGT